MNVNFGSLCLAGWWCICDDGYCFLGQQVSNVWEESSSATGSCSVRRSAEPKWTQSGQETLMFMFSSVLIIPCVIYSKNYLLGNVWWSSFPTLNFCLCCEHCGTSWLLILYSSGAGSHGQSWGFGWLPFASVDSVIWDVSTRIWICICIEIILMVWGNLLKNCFLDHGCLLVLINWHMYIGFLLCRHIHMKKEKNQLLESMVQSL